MKNISLKISILFAFLVLFGPKLSAQCTASFTHNANQSNGVVAFWDTSIPTFNDSIITYNWNFGDGVTATQKNPVHAYSTAGLYTITLFVGDNSSMDGETIQILMTVPYPATCVAAATYLEGTPSAGNFPFTFTDASTLADNSTVISAVWNFGDGNTSTSLNPTHTYTTAGTYNVSYTIATSLGCNSTGYLWVDPDLCPTSWIDSISTDFPDPNIITIWPLVGTAPYTFSWYYFPNGTYTNTPVLPADLSNGGATINAHELTNCAAYRFVITDANGCTSGQQGLSSCFSGPLNVYANFVSLQQGNSKTVDFSDLSYVDGGNQNTRVWDFGDGNTSVLPIATHTYQNYGSYAVKLIASYPGSADDTIVTNINVSPCNYVFTANIDITSLNVLTASSTGGIGNLSYSWTSSLNSVVLGNTAAITVNQVGYFIVAIQDANGCIAETPAMAYNPHFQDTCDANFGFAINQGATSQDSLITFFSAELNWGMLTNPHTYTWTYSDGYVNTQNYTISQRPYPMPNVFDVTLTVSGSNCSSSITQTIYADNSGCNLSPANFFTNQALFNQVYPLPILGGTFEGTQPYSYLWNDGSTAPILYAYSSGTYCVDVTDGNGCTLNQCYTYYTNQGSNITLCGNVFSDLNNNGIQDNGELAYVGVSTVTASNGTNNYNATVNGSGYYSMQVPSGNYTISYSIPNGNLFSTPFSADTTAIYNNIVANPSTYNCGYNFGISNNTSLVSGKLFYDANSNGVYDVTEYGIAYQPITAGIYTVFTDSIGNFNMNVVSNTYNLTYTPINAFSTYTLTTPGSISINAITTGNSFLNKNFGIVTNNFGVDLGINLWPTNDVNNGFPAKYTIGYFNNGLTSGNNTIVMTYDTSLTYVSSTLGGAVINATAHTVTWTVPTVTSFTNNYLYVDFVASVSLSMNSPVTCSATIGNANNSDVNVVNNTTILNQLSVSSFDPNDKRSIKTNNDNPTHQVISTMNANQEIEYMIRFQNIGNASAVNVRIVDELSSLLDEESYVLLGGSHNCQVIRLGNVVTYKFDNIMLPSEDDGGEASNGFVTFKINALPGLNVGDLISDHAKIYFDYNQPILTNYANILMVDPAVVTDTQFRTILSNAIGVYPNPIRTVGYVKFILDEDTEIHTELFDLSGKSVMTSNKMANKGMNYFELNTATLQTGMYVLKVTGTHVNIIHKVNILKP